MTADSSPSMGSSPLPPNRLPTNSTLPFWRTQLHELDSHRSTPDLPSTCDTLIIGSGYSGVSLAYHLVKSYEASQEKIPSILMLEARQACSGATGRNGGHCKPSPYFNFPQLAELYGFDAAQEIAQFELSQPQAIKDLVEEENIDCDFQITRACDAMLDQTHADLVTAAFEETRKADATSLRSVQYTGPRDAEQISGVKGALCCFTFPAAHLWPYKLVMHLLSLVVSKGVNLQTTTPVLSVSSNPNSDGTWTIETSRGSIRAKKVIFATNGYTGYIEPRYASKIIPVRGICTRIACPEGRRAPHLPNTYSIRFGPPYTDYLIPRADSSIIVGGARQALRKDEKLWYNIADDSEIVEEASQYFEGYMQRNFRGWEDSGAKLDRVWSGIMGYTTDLAAHVGEVPDKPRQFIIAGFNGHGMPEILSSAKELAKMIKEGISFEETGMPRILKTSIERLKSEKNFIAREAIYPDAPPEKEVGGGGKLPNDAKSKL